MDIIRMTDRNFSVISGDDFLFLPLLAVGGKGVISVTSNVAPRDMSLLYEAFTAGDMRKAMALNLKLWPLHKAMFYEVNPQPAKTGLAMMGRVEETFRLPLVRMGKENRARLYRALADYGLLKKD